MSLLGIHLTLMMGPTTAVPVPFSIAEALTSVEVTHNDSRPSGFQLTFQVGRSGPLDLLDYGLVAHPLMRPFMRVILLVRLAIVPQVLMDGIITQIQLSPSDEPGASTLTVIGEDVSVMMDLKEKTDEHPAQNEKVIADKILLSYQPYLLFPAEVVPPLSLDVPLPSRRIPTQHATDRQFLQTLAARYAYVFYVKPGPLPGQNIAYWGPPERLSLPQTALSVNMGPASNVTSINFQYNSLSPTLVSGAILDSETNLPIPVITPPLSTRRPLALQPALVVNQPNVRTTLPVEASGETVEGLMAEVPGRSRLTRGEAEAALGLSFVQAQTRAQATLDASCDRVVTASGDLDALRYGDLLQARGIVGVRGVGFSYDGDYYVQSVTHSIRKGEYKQRFTLNREGTGSLTPFVRP